MLKIQKFLCIILCLCFVAGGVAACGQGEAADNRDFSKLSIPVTDTDFKTYEFSTPENEEQFNEYVENYIYNSKRNNNKYIAFDIFYDKSNEVATEEVLSLNYYWFSRKDDSIWVAIRFDDIDIEAIMDLTENEKVKEIVFADSIIK
ncbi:MAG: hypothetical protein IJX55_05585 [Clostridia bacterium]|nr:hypothetical protein [Clostridia bacterium]